MTNSWTIEFTDDALKALSKMDKPVQKRVLKFLKERVQGAENPLLLGKPLVGNRTGIYRFRVGDYRILTEVNEGKLLILVVGIDHRRKVYKSH